MSLFAIRWVFSPMESEESLRRYFSETPISEDFKRRIVLKEEVFPNEDSGSFIFWD